MKKQLLHWAYLLVAGLALGACGGDDAEDTPTPPTPSTPTGKWSVTIKAGVDETRGLSLSGTTLSVNWSTSETVYAYYGGQKVGELHPTDDFAGSDVTLQGNLNAANYVVGQSLTLKFPRETNEYTGQAGTIEDIAAKYDYLEATVSISTIDATSHTMTVSNASFTSKQAIARLTFNADLAANDVITITGAAGDAAVSVTLASAVTAGNYVYVALPLTGSDTSYTLDFVVKRSGSAVSGGSLVNKTLKNNKFYGASVTLGNISNLDEATSADVGKVIGADGKLYATKRLAEAAGTTAVALIAYVGTAGSVDESSLTYKGLAIAMEDCSTTTNWCDINSISDQCSNNDYRNNSILTVRNWINGFSRTDDLVKKAGHNHWAAKAVKSYNVSPASGTSGWFLPSMGQWQLIIQGLVSKKSGTPYTANITTTPNSNMESSNFNSILTNAGAAGLQAAGYWSCSEADNSSAWRMMFDNGKANYTSKNGDSNKNYVRAVLAF